MQQIGLISPSSNTITVQMTIEEFIAYKKEPAKKTIKKGLAGIREVFQCSNAQAFKIAHSAWFQPCIVKMGKLILFDADQAWELAKSNIDVNRI